MREKAGNPIGPPNSDIPIPTFGGQIPTIRPAHSTLTRQDLGKYLHCMIPDLFIHVGVPQRAQCFRIRDRLTRRGHAIHPVAGHGALKSRLQVPATRPQRPRGRIPRAGGVEELSLPGLLHGRGDEAEDGEEQPPRERHQDGVPGRVEAGDRVEEFIHEVGADPARVDVDEADGWVALGDVLEGEGLHRRRLIDDIRDGVVVLQREVVGDQFPLLAAG